MDKANTDYRLNLAFACKPVALSAPLPDRNDPFPVRFTGVAYSGGVIPAYGALGDVAIDLSSLQNPDAVDIPVLIDHSDKIDSIAGKGTLSRVGDALHITGELTQSTEAGKKVSALMSEGFPLQMSVGMQAALRKGNEYPTVNGQTMSVRHVFGNARILEVSFVPSGADPNTHVSKFSATPVLPANLKGVTMTRTAEDQALIDGLQSKITTLTENLSAAQAAITAATTEQRKTELSALFTEIGKDMPADVTHFVNMSADQFKAVAQTMREMKPAAAARALFSSQSVAMASGKTTPESQDKVNALLASVKKIST